MTDRVAIAESIDGRTFGFRASVDDPLPIGTYVLLDPGGDVRYLAQVLRQQIDEDGETRRITGGGTLLARVDRTGHHRIDGSDVFGAAVLTEASDSTVVDHFDSVRTSAGLRIGELQRQTGVPAILHAGGFGRHTFLCGQSGSGKTYTLGLVLEQLLLGTDIRLVVLDPNSDYVNMGQLRPQASSGVSAEEYEATASRFAEVAPHVHVFGTRSTALPLQAWFSRLTFEQQTMVLGLDPFTHPEEYNAFVRIRHGFGDRHYSVRDVLDAVLGSFAEDQRRLGLRIENLGVADLSIWASDGQTAIADVLQADWRMMVADLGSLSSETESAIAAAGILGVLWERRHERRPVIIVVDEAHNICPERPQSPNQALATEHLVRIAGEGRKFGLYVLLATQRPDKVNRNVVSQCENLVLMKMNSATDIDQLADLFSFAPRALIEQASGFGLGEGLAAGRIAPDPILFRSGHRLTVEGGSDVPATWAASR
jgi:hypothetical protein